MASDTEVPLASDLVAFSPSVNCDPALKLKKPTNSMKVPGVLVSIHTISTTDMVTHRA